VKSIKFENSTGSCTAGMGNHKGSRATFGGLPSARCSSQPNSSNRLVHGAPCCGYSNILSGQGSVQRRGGRRIPGLRLYGLAVQIDAVQAAMAAKADGFRRGLYPRGRPRPDVHRRVLYVDGGLELHRHKGCHGSAVVCSPELAPRHDAVVPVTPLYFAEWPDLESSENRCVIPGQ
jgi:hypothetical protein